MCEYSWERPRAIPEIGQEAAEMAIENIEGSIESLVLGNVYPDIGMEAIAPTGEPYLDFVMAIGPEACALLGVKSGNHRDALGVTSLFEHPLEMKNKIVEVFESLVRDAFPSLQTKNKGTLYWRAKPALHTSKDGRVYIIRARTLISNKPIKRED